MQFAAPEGVPVASDTRNYMFNDDVPNFLFDDVLNYLFGDAQNATKRKLSSQSLPLLSSPGKPHHHPKMMFNDVFSSECSIIVFLIISRW